MTAISLASTTGTGFLEADFNQIKGLIQSGGYTAPVFDVTTITPKSVSLTVAPTDGAWSGITGTFTAGGTATIGQVAYLKSDGKMWLAKADAEGTSDTLLGLATATILPNASGVYLIKGFLQAASVFNFTIGKKQYLSSGTAGLVVETAPSTSTNIVRILGYGKTADIMYFDPDKTYITVT